MSKQTTGLLVSAPILKWVSIDTDTYRYCRVSADTRYQYRSNPTGYYNFSFWLTKLHSSDFLRKVETESISRFLEQVLTQFWHCIVPEGPAIGTGGHRIGFTPMRVRLRRVWKSLYLQLKILGQKLTSNQHQILYKRIIEIKSKWKRHITTTFFTTKSQL